MSDTLAATDRDTMTALVIDHNHGTDVTIHRTHDGALTKINQFVNDWWADEMDEPMPADPNEARQAYFEAVEHESYTIVDATIMD